MLELARRDDIFAPQIALRAKHVVRLVRGDALGQRVVGIDLLQRRDVEPAGRLVAAAALQAVEVERIARRHHDVMPHVGGVDPALFAAPRHDRGGGGQAAFQDLVPADQAAALGLEVGAELFDHPALQGVFGLDAQRLHLRLHLGAAFPLVLDRFVAAEVDVSAGEDRHQLVEHVLDEGDALRPRIEQIGHDAPIVADQRPVAEDAELRIGGDERVGVAGQVDLRHDGDAADAGIGDQFLQLCLGVEAADAVLLGRLGSAGPRRQPPAADAGELGVFLDFDTPALIVRQVEVERVELHARHLVDDRPQRRHGEEVARGVDHQPAPAEARCVGDGEGGDGDGFAERRIGAEQLRERHRAMDEAAVPRCRDGDPLRRDREAIGFVAGDAGVADEADRAGGAGGEREAAGGADMVGEQAGGGAGAGVGRGDGRAVGGGEAARTADHGLRHRQQRERRLCARLRDGRGGGGEQGQRRSPDDGCDTDVLRHACPLVMFWYCTYLEAASSRRPCPRIKKSQKRPRRR